MSDHILDGETLAVPGNDSDPTATALAPAAIAIELGVNFESFIPAGPGFEDRRIHFGLSGGVSTDPIAVVASDILEPALGYPPILDATGATAGTPGTFTPTGSRPPEDLAGMSALVASPLSLWTVGQSVQPLDGSDVHWNGSIWATGVAPA